MPTPLPPAIQRSLTLLGINISRARRRRRWTQNDLAEQIGISVNTLRRLEQGLPGLSIEHLISLMSVMGEIQRFNELLDSSQDRIGTLLQDERLPQRIRRKRSEEV